MFQINCASLDFQSYSNVIWFYTYFENWLDDHSTWDSTSGPVENFSYMDKMYMPKLRRLELRPAEMPSICCHLVIQKEKLVSIDLTNLLLKKDLDIIKQVIRTLVAIWMTLSDVDNLQLVLQEVCLALNHKVDITESSSSYFST